jgi:hypothetical protein
MPGQITNQPLSRGQMIFNVGISLIDLSWVAPLVPDATGPLGCLESTNEYPSVLARRSCNARAVTRPPMPLPPMTSLVMR